MKNKNTFDDIAKTITGMLPEGISNIQKDLEANIKTTLQNGLSKMNLDTRRV